MERLLHVSLNYDALSVGFIFTVCSKWALVHSYFISWDLVWFLALSEWKYCKCLLLRIVSVWLPLWLCHAPFFFFFCLGVRLVVGVWLVSRAKGLWTAFTCHKCLPIPVMSRSSKYNQSRITHFAGGIELRLLFFYVVSMESYWFVYQELLHQCPHYYMKACSGVFAETNLMYVDVRGPKHHNWTCLKLLFRGLI